MRAFHGSPHVFDRFDMNKVGTGEGTQAFSHGLYFTTDESLARSFRDRLASGAPYKWMASDNPEQIAAGARAAYGDKAVAELRRQTSGGGYNRIAVKRAIELLKANASVPEVPRGRVYEVELPADGQYLNWRKPGPDGRPGWAVYDEAVNQYGSQRAASEALRARGYQGVLYEPADMPGVSNYAMWDDELIDVLRKYGIAGLMTGGAGGGLLSAALERQERA